MPARTHPPTPDTTVAELLAGWPSAKRAVGRRGMACVGCSMARFETIAEAAAAYGFDARGFIDEVIHPKAHACTRSATQARAISGA